MYVRTCTCTYGRYTATCRYTALCTKVVPGNTSTGTTGSTCHVMYVLCTCMYGTVQVVHVLPPTVGVLVLTRWCTLHGTHVVCTININTCTCTVLYMYVCVVSIVSVL